MNRILMTTLSALLAAAPACAQLQAKILKVSGVVRVAPPVSEVYSAAAVNQPLTDGMTVMTGDNGRVTIEIGAKNQIRLRANAKITVGAGAPRLTTFKLVSGKIKGYFRGLTGGEKFNLELEGNSAIASVKGTVFAAENGDGTVKVSTIYGDIVVNVKNTMFDVPQGTELLTKGNGKFAVGSIPDGDLDAWMAAEEGTSADDTSALHGFVTNIRNDSAQDAEVITQIREDDFAVGRTLKDMHGNIARVDQRLARPTPDTIQFINLVKRDSYTYRGKFSYAGSSGPRYDYLETQATANMGLPASLQEWPSFFQANGHEFKIIERETTIANGRPRDPGHDAIQFYSHDSDYYTRHHLAPRHQWDGMYLSSVPGGTPDTLYIFDDEATPVTSNGLGSGELWGTAVLSAYKDTDNTGKLEDNLTHDKEHGHLGEFVTANRIDFQVEGYLLNQDGKVMGITDFTQNKIDDPFGFAKTLAFETIVSVRNSNGGSMLNRGNIDLVIIPDMVVAGVQKLIPLAASGSLGN